MELNLHTLYYTHTHIYRNKVSALCQCQYLYCDLIHNFQNVTSGGNWAMYTSDLSVLHLKTALISIKKSTLKRQCKRWRQRKKGRDEGKDRFYGNKIALIHQNLIN